MRSTRARARAHLAVATIADNPNTSVASTDSIDVEAFAFAARRVNSINALSSLPSSSPYPEKSHTIVDTGARTYRCFLTQASSLHFCVSCMRDALFLFPEFTWRIISLSNTENAKAVSVVSRKTFSLFPSGSCDRHCHRRRRCFLAGGISRPSNGKCLFIAFSRAIVLGGLKKKKK